MIFLGSTGHISILFGLGTSVKVFSLHYSATTVSSTTSGTGISATSGPTPGIQPVNRFQVADATPPTASTIVPGIAITD